MKKLFPYISIIALALLLILPEFASAQGVVSAAAGAIFGTGFDVVGWVLTPISYAILKFISLITLLTGVILNGAIFYTVVEMSTNIKAVAIDSTWTVVRDIANMGFIFVLLWASLKHIMGDTSGTQQFIVKLIVAAILINFSLFFTKFAIDIANLLALTFYGAIVPASALSTNTFTSVGLSNAITDSLQISSIWNSIGTLEGAGTILTISLLSSVVLLITSFVFLAMAVMLVIRYVVLIFVLILSPIAFVSGVLPGLSGVAKQWKDTLVGQALFAPIFFLMMWITVKVIGGVATSTFGKGAGFASVVSGGETGLFNNDVVATFINFGVIIAFLIGSIIISKQYADMAPGGVGKITKWATGFASGAVFNKGLGGLGRTTLGRIGANAASDPNLIMQAEKETGLKGARARLNLYAAKRMASGSYDARNMTVPTSVVGDAIRGTVGRTPIGKSMGLNDIRLDQLDAKIGSFAAEQTGVGDGVSGGYKEMSSEADKRLRTESMERAGEVKKAENKIKVQEGISTLEAIGTGTANPTQTATIKAAVDVIKNTSEKDIENQKASTLSKPEFAEALSQKQLEAIEKSDKFTAAEVQAIKTARAQRFNDAYATNNGPEIIQALKKMSYVDVAKLDESKLTNTAMLDIYTPKFLNKLGKINELTDTKATAIRNAIINNAATNPALANSVTWLNGPGSNIF